MPLYRSDQIVQGQGKKVLVYGRHGVGKTSLLRSLMHTNPLLVDAERGSLSIANTGCAVWPCQTNNDFAEFMRWVKGSHEAAQFGSIFVDTMTEIAERYEAVSVEQNSGKGKELRAAYNEVLKQMSVHFRDLRDLQGPNVVFLAQESRFKDDSTGGMITGAEFPGWKLGPSSPRFVDEVFRLHILKNAQGQPVRALRCHPNAQEDAKDRSGLLAELEPADLGYIFNKMSGVA